MLRKLLNKNSRVTVNESVALKTLFYQFVEEHYDLFQDYYLNLDKILYVRDSSHSKIIEIYPVEGILRSLFPKHQYVIIMADQFQEMPLTKKALMMAHILSHIPLNFSGDIKPHDSESFVIEQQVLKKPDNRKYKKFGKELRISQYLELVKIFKEKVRNSSELQSIFEKEVTETYSLSSGLVG